jgi:hypothetical protein
MLVSNDIFHCDSDRDAMKLRDALRKHFYLKTEIWDFRLRTGPAGSTAVYAFANHADAIEGEREQREFTTFAEGFYAGLTYDFTRSYA